MIPDKMMISILSILVSSSQALIAKNCLQEHIQLAQHESIEINTPAFPGYYDGALTCTYKIQAPEGYRPAIEFLAWDMPDCSLDKFMVIDRKIGQHYSQFCGFGIPAPLTAVGRFLEIVVSFSSRGESGWGLSKSAVRMKIRVSLVRNANWKGPITPKSNEYRYTSKSHPTSVRRTKSDDWDLSFSNEEITNIAIGGAFVFITILGGLLFSFHLRREEERKNNEEELEKQGHPRPTGYRAYLSKIQITPSDEAQTSSTDISDSTERSSNTDSNPATDSPILKEKTKTTRDQRRKRANDRFNNRTTNNRTTMERFQRDLNIAFRSNGINAEPNGINAESIIIEDSDIIRDNYERNFVPENPKNNQVDVSGRQTRYKDQDYERWTQTTKVKRSETMREKLRRAFSLKSMKETIQREKSRLYGPHARPPMRQRKENDPQDKEDI